MPHWVGYIFILNLCSTLLTEVYIVLTLTGKIVSLLNVSLTTFWFYKPRFQFPFLSKLVRSLQWKQLLTVNEIRVQLLISLLVLGHCGNTSPLVSLFLSLPLRNVILNVLLRESSIMSPRKSIVSLINILINKQLIEWNKQRTPMICVCKIGFV